MMEDRVKQQNVIIENKLGIHARPASMIVQKAMEFDSDIYLKKDDVRINGKSILSVMMLAAEKGSTVEIITEGEDENDALSAIIELFKNKFNEE